MSGRPKNIKTKPESNDLNENMSEIFTNDQTSDEKNSHENISNDSEENILDKMSNMIISAITPIVEVIDENIIKPAEKEVVKIKEFLDIDNDGRITTKDAKSIFQLALAVGTIVFVLQIQNAWSDLVKMFTSDNWDWVLVNQLIWGQFGSIFFSVFWRIYDKNKRVSKEALKQRIDANILLTEKLDEINEQMKYIQRDHREDLKSLEYAHSLDLIELRIPLASKDKSYRELLKEKTLFDEAMEKISNKKSQNRD